VNWSNPIVYGFLIVLGGILCLVLWAALGLPRPF
jgi:hypothetical protein